MPTTKIDLVTQVYNVLQPHNGGTGITDFPDPVAHPGFLFSDGTTVTWRSTAVNDQLLQAISAQLESIRLALVQIACDGGRARPEDFNVDAVKSDQLDGGVQ